ncbi:hypothetical protein C8N42_106213 [Celeribacter persicus]|uniref:Uncharacterized protein n=1 Tax=Celeribacter persicus TaxID=1651082 RepID=A0A2T5HMC4_9RHOB|nr:hypothetical protein C8N42_106213 [Celeribacter persicus]
MGAEQGEAAAPAPAHPGGLAHFTGAQTSENRNIFH